MVSSGSLADAWFVELLHGIDGAESFLLCRIYGGIWICISYGFLWCNKQTSGYIRRYTRGVLRWLSNKLLLRYLTILRHLSYIYEYNPKFVYYTTGNDKRYRSRFPHRYYTIKRRCSFNNVQQFYKSRICETTRWYHSTNEFALTRDTLRFS
jgi:hypothetical protein